MQRGVKQCLMRCRGPKTHNDPLVLLLSRMVRKALHERLEPNPIAQRTVV